MLPHANRGALTARASKAAAAALLAVGVAAAALLLPAATASAAEIPAAITHVTTDKSEYGYNDKIRLDFDWAVPDSAAAGDTFRLELPEELKAAALAKFSLLAPDGSIVADAAWNGKEVIFSLTDYVDTHDAVTGSGYLTAQWDHNNVPETSAPVVLQFDSNAVQVVIGDKPAPPQPCTENCTPSTPPTHRALWKSGHWSDGSAEGTSRVADNINWKIQLPGDETGHASAVHLVDTPSAGSVIDCGTITVVSQNSLAGTAPQIALDPSRYSVSCSPSSFRIDFDRVNPSEFITVNYQGTITNQLSGTYGNHVEVTTDGVTTTKDIAIQRTAAGGTGAGVQSVSVGDYVWMDSNADGVQDSDESGIAGVVLTLTGPGGAPVTDVTGAPVGPTTTDSSGHYLFAGLPVLPAGQHYTVTIDPKASATALDGLSPTQAHAGDDRAADSSTTSAESSDLTTNGAADRTLDFGFVLPELPTLALPGDPTSSTGPAQLAHTGVGDIAPALAAALSLLVLGAAGTVIARRRQA